MELLTTLVELFLGELQTRLARIREAREADDLELLHQTAHALKGSVGNFAAAPAFEAARLVCDLSQQGQMKINRSGLRISMNGAKHTTSMCARWMHSQSL